MAAVKISLNLPSIPLCPDDEQSLSISRDDSMASSEINIPWIVIPRVSVKLVEFEEVSKEIRNIDPNTG